MIDFRHRKRYAACVRESSVPAYLMMVLGSSAPSFCRHQSMYCAFMSQDNESSSILIALEKGRIWKRHALRQRLKKADSTGDDEATQQEHSIKSDETTVLGPRSLIADQVGALACDCY